MNNSAFSDFAESVRRFFAKFLINIKYLLTLLGVRAIEFWDIVNPAHVFKGAKSKKKKTSSVNKQLEQLLGPTTPKWWRITSGILTTLGRALATVVLVCVITGCIVGCASMIYILMFLDKDINFDLYQLQLSYTTTIYTQTADGGWDEYQKLHGSQNREWVSYEEIPDVVKDAFKAVEDHRFDTHHGVDWRSTIGCIGTYVLNGSSRGGSTITQQLIKNVTGEDDVSVERKIKEIFRALALEKEYSKETILEAYLNVIPLGNGCNGVKTAAMTYFGKELNELTLAEAASIAGITKNPSAYNPLYKPEKNKERQMIVLGEMLEYGFITQEEYDAAKVEELVFNSDSKYDSNSATYNNWYVDQIIYDLRAELQELGYSLADANYLIYNGGLSIYSCMDAKMQEKCEKIFEDSKNFLKFPGTTQPQCAAVIMDYNGAVKCILGARGVKEGNLVFSYATQAKRQPGSSMKPLSAFGPAVAYGILEYSTPVTDDKITLSDGSRWPRNSGNNYRGNIPACKGLEVSSNCVTVRIARKLTPTTMFKFMTERLSLDLVESGSKNDVNLSASIGGLTRGVTVLEMTAAYAIFGNNGIFHEPYTYYKVTDADGNVLITHSANDGTRVMSAEAATIMNRMLRLPIIGTNGTAKSAAFGGYPIFGKTGTTSNDYDRYFAGGTPYYVSACWFGYEVQKTLSIKNPNHAQSAWRKIMVAAHEGLPYKGFTLSSNVRAITYCTESGGLAGPGCTNTATGYYARGSSMPICPVHSGGTATDAFTQFIDDTESFLTTTTESTTTSTTTSTSASTTTTTTTESTTTTTTTESTTTTTTTAPDVGGGDDEVYG